mgnify:CR=1 FL=1
MEGGGGSGDGSDAGEPVQRTAGVSMGSEDFDIDMGDAAPITTAGGEAEAPATEEGGSGRADAPAQCTASVSDPGDDSGVTPSRRRKRKFKNAQPQRGGSTGTTRGFEHAEYRRREGE